MVEVAIVPVEAWHLPYIAERMRAVDVRECREIGGVEPLAALEQSVACPGPHWTALFDGEPVALFGVTQDTLIGGGIGAAWLLGTDRLQRDWRAFARASKPVVRELLTRYRALSNVLLTDNTLCMRWLAWLGADFHVHAPYARFLLCAM
ncbi:hypothetical protein ACFCQI_01580 [Rhodanobacter sp. FW102-FHT14D06]|uniref:Uncharacterized protein n=2 Tax=unclassified Rhodanobacter TaxID=2621553 RepID=A0AB74UXX4_9GAMM|nr:hypothetical protein [Rhodanobacter sp.]